MKLERTLGLRDVILLNITAIIGLRWISLAAAGGNTSLVLWILALLLFFIPQAMVVMELTARFPGEGGIYIWVKEAFGEFHGFIAGWCYWTNNLVYFPNLLVYIAGISIFVYSDIGASFDQNRLYVLMFSLTALWMVTVFNIVGLKFGKWLNNIGGFGTWLTGAVLIIFAIISVIRYGLANPMPVSSFYTGMLSFDKITFWASMCFGFAGLELASLIAGEVKNPARTIPRGVIISGVIIAAIYILGTLAIIVTLPLNDINVISGFLQGITAVGLKLGLGWTSNIIALLITLGGIGGLMAWFTAAARLPFVAGVDNYLPATFSRLHPRFTTPYIAVLVQAVIATGFILMSFMGSSVEEAYLILLDTTLLVYFIPYSYMFCAYIVLRRKTQNDPEQTKLIPANNSFAFIIGLSGLLTTAAAILLSIIPPMESGNMLIYEIKVVGGALMFLIIGWLFYNSRKKVLS